MRIVAVVLAATACAPVDLADPPAAPLPEDWEALPEDQGRMPVVPGLQFSQEALVPDTDVTFTVRGAAPGDLVRFLYSTTGTGAGPCIRQLGGLCLGLLTPITEFDQTLADASGTATVSFFLPIGTPQIYVFTQAVVDRGAGSVATNTITAPVLAGALDQDGDGYCGGATCADALSSPGDCQDLDPQVHPGNQPYSTAPFLTEAGAPSWDWDCDGVETRQRTDLYSCTPNGGLPICPSTSGFAQAVPRCGDQGTWSAGCTDFPLVPICSASQQSQVTQACR